MEFLPLLRLLCRLVDELELELDEGDVDDVEVLSSRASKLTSAVDDVAVLPAALKLPFADDVRVCSLEPRTPLVRMLTR